MQGTIAQTLALVMHGSAYLRGLSRRRIYPDNSTFRFCKSVTFDGGAASARTPDEWFARLEADGVRDVFVAYDGPLGPGITDRMSVGFAGGSRWRILAGAAWEGRWSVGDRDEPQRKIWNVTYERIRRGHAAPPAGWSVEEAVRQLTEAFASIAVFAREQQLGGFADQFDSALDVLRTPACLRRGYHEDLAPPGLISNQSMRILDAAQLGWVFGGMGSWNDLGFEGAVQQRYGSLSDELYMTLNRALVTAVNAR